MSQSLDLLVIDDSAADRKLVGMAISRLECDVKIYNCKNGGEALEFLNERQAEPAETQHPLACLLDYKMPGLSGLDVLKVIKSDMALRSVPVFMFSSSNDTQDVSACYDAHANGYIKKPHSSAELDIIARRLVDLLSDTMEFP